MSNRYLFRGKLKEDSQSFKTYKAGSTIFGGIYYEGSKVFIIAHSNIFEVIPETVGQCCYTLKDGTKVFKGDRVKVKGMKRTGVYETKIIASIQGFTLEENKTYLGADSCFIAIIEVIHD
jgi:hypothetical protein